MVTRSSRPVLATAMCLGLAAVAPCQAAPMFTVVPTPAARSVIEGDSGIFNFTVTNVGILAITITDVRLFANSVPESIEFVGGDKNDEVYNTTLLMEANCEGKVLARMGTCQFQQTFDTRDLDKPASGTNVGIWTIDNVVEAVDSEGVIDGKVTSAQVEVRDPGAPSTIPEPSSALLAAVALAGLGLIARRRPARAA